MHFKHINRGRGMVKFEQNQFELKHQPRLDLKVPVLIKKKRVIASRFSLPKILLKYFRKCLKQLYLEC